MYRTPQLLHFQYNIDSNLRKFEVSRIDKDSIVRPIYGDVDSIKCVTPYANGNLVRGVGTNE